MSEPDEKTPVGQVGFRASLEYRKQLALYATEKGMTVQHLIRLALDAYLPHLAKFHGNSGRNSAEINQHADAELLPPKDLVENQHPPVALPDAEDYSHERVGGDKAYLYVAVKEINEKLTSFGHQLERLANENGKRKRTGNSAKSTRRP